MFMKSRPQNLMISSPHPDSGVRLYRVKNPSTADAYELFLVQNSKKHHAFWKSQHRRFKQCFPDGGGSDANYQEFMRMNENAFSQYNKFVWKSNFVGLWIYIKARILRW